MCGRFVLTTPAEALRRIFGFIEQPNLAPRYIGPVRVARWGSGLREVAEHREGAGGAADTTDAALGARAVLGG